MSSFNVRVCRFFFFSSRRRHTRYWRDWSSDVCSSDLFGVMGVAPPEEWGQISTKEPRAHGGNLDNKEIGEGATLFLPVHVPDANFSAGDDHGVQGDGEVCINALKMCL